MGIKIETFPVAQPQTERSERLTWTENPAVQGLLDVVVSILAEEYVQTVKRHPGEFSHNGGTT